MDWMAKAERVAQTWPTKVNGTGSLPDTRFLLYNFELLFISLSQHVLTKRRRYHFLINRQFKEHDETQIERMILILIYLNRIVIYTFFYSKRIEIKPQCPFVLNLVG